MEGLGYFYYVMIVFYNCLNLVVLGGVIGGIVYFNKRLSDTSGFRKILAVVAGILVVYIGKYVGGVISGLSFLVVLNQEQTLSELFISGLFTSPFTILLALFAFGAFSIVSTISGYIAGKVSRQNEVVCGLVVGIVYA